MSSEAKESGGDEVLNGASVPIERVDPSKQMLIDVMSKVILTDARRPDTARKPSFYLNSYCADLYRITNMNRHKQNLISRF